MSNKDDLKSNPDWLRLQRMIFTRWANQKVAKRHLRVDDIVTGLADGIFLINLIEELSEKPFTEKYDKKPKGRPQMLDNCNLALKFTYEQGVEMKIKASAEDLVDGDVKNVLGLVWAIMLKFIKIGDDDEGEQLNAKDALLMWVKNKTHGYAHVSIENFKKSFHDGLAFCALIHKHRPNLVPYETLSPEDKIGNLKLAIDAAEKYFALEKYLAPEDIPKLDENSMVIYVSDYYYGISAQRKLDVAASRIGKLITFTEVNDAARADYNKVAASLQAHIAQVKPPLEDTTIHNTMAGAKKRLEEFYAYKSKDKNEILADQLNLEEIFNTLSLRLKNHKRPPFTPASGQSLSDFAADIKHLAAREKEQNVALHAELNRQIKLAKLNDHHQSLFDALKPWIAQKEAYLKTKESINSVSQAQLNLKLLDAYDQESAAIHRTNIADLTKLGAELVAEKFEGSDSVKAREAEVSEGSTKLAQLSKEKRPVLDDHLARELFKEKVRLLVLQHTDKDTRLNAWIKEKEDYLATREKVDSISEAQTQLGLWEAYEKEYASATTTLVASHKSLGEDILAQKYETQYSSYVYEKPDEIKGRLSTVESKWKGLAESSAEKKRVLDDHLARELFKEKVRQMNHSHQTAYDRLKAWIEEKEAYLNKKEEIASISDASTQLGLLAGYQAERESQQVSFTSHQALGNDILAQKYETKYSSYVWEKPDEIKARMSFVDSKSTLLASLAAEKKNVLDDDLAREEFKEKVRQMDHTHNDSHQRLKAWIAEKEAYLLTKEEIDSIAEAQTALAVLDVYENDKVVATNNSLAKHQELGKDILAQKYQTKYSSYVWGKPEEVQARMTFADDKWKVLSDLSGAKKKVLDEDLAREIEKERLRLEFAGLASDYTRWTKDLAQSLSITLFGFTLAEVEAFKSTLDKSTAEISAESEKIKAGFTNADSKMKELGVKVNVYTKLTLTDLAASESTLTSALDSRSKAYETELERQRQNDALCREFAGLANPLAQFVNETTDKVSNSSAALEDQFQFVKERQAKAGDESANIPKIKELDGKIKDRGITQNIHSNLNAQDIEALWQQYTLFLSKKSKMLEEEVKNKQLRGLTPEDYKEIEENFKIFDTDKSGNIDKKELKACLYSLGEEKTKSEIEAIMKEYGTNGRIPYERFKDFMVVVYGDNDTADEINNGFKLINHGGEVALVDKMSRVMDAHSLDYVTKTAPKSGEGYDYVAWTTSVFAR